MNAEFPNINDNVLKVYDNAAEYLLTPQINSSVPQTEINPLKFDGRKILNPERKTISVYTLSGVKILQSNLDIDMNALPKGIYIVRTDDAQIIKFKN
jgi:hypothetical protein